jgi:hypothetical protein
MKHIKTISLVAMLGLFFPPYAMSGGMTKRDFLNANQAIQHEYQQALKVCDTLNWNASDICIVEANGKRLTKAAELLANYKPSAKLRYMALIAHASANYEVAITCCNDIPIEARNSCWNNAQAMKDAETFEAYSFWGTLSQ